MAHFYEIIFLHHYMDVTQTIHYKAFSGIGWANYEIKSSIEFNYRTLVLPTSDYQFFQVESIHDYPPVRTGVCID